MTSSSFLLRAIVRECVAIGLRAGGQVEWNQREVALKVEIRDASGE